MSLVHSTFSLPEYAETLGHCRNLVNGLRVKRIVVPDDVFLLVNAVMECHDPPYGPFAFSDVRGEPGYHYLEWNGVLLCDTRMPLLEKAFTFDIALVPFVYTNQAGVEMQVVPPWVELPKGAGGRRVRLQEPEPEKTGGGRRIILLPEDEA